jgi:hypothetical protein
MNNWNYTKYIPVVPHYLANNYEQVYKDLCDIWSRLLVPSDFDRMKKESHQIGNVCRAIGYEFAGDQEAKGAFDDPVSSYSIPYTDLKPFIMKYIVKRWQDSWDQ